MTGAASSMVSYEIVLLYRTPDLSTAKLVIPTSYQHLLTDRLLNYFIS